MAAGEVLTFEFVPAIANRTVLAFLVIVAKAAQLICHLRYSSLAELSEVFPRKPFVEKFCHGQQIGVTFGVNNCLDGPPIIGRVREGVVVRCQSNGSTKNVFDCSASRLKLPSLLPHSVGDISCLRFVDHHLVVIGRHVLCEQEIKQVLACVRATQRHLELAT